MILEMVSMPIYFYYIKIIFTVVGNSFLVSPNNFKFSDQHSLT